MTVPGYVLRPPSGFYRSLNPTTKLVSALCVALLAFILRGWVAPIVAIAIVGAVVARAHLGRAFLPFVLATVPVLISILLINTFLYPGATDTIFTVGPFQATGSGLTVAGQASLRIVAFALSVAVFALTTPTDDLLADLERRGLGRRGSFVIGSAIQAIPRLAARAREVTDSQRARGLDTEGSPWRRIRGVVPLAGPMISGALSEVEERTMALEARAFSAPAQRAILRPMPDDGVQRLARWLFGVATLGLFVATLTGHLSLP
ncbi:MAG: energy-coupling factor transporter transmembrane component T [Candidatus Limnocylindrales bacterium]